MVGNLPALAHEPFPTAVLELEASSLFDCHEADVDLLRGLGRPPWMPGEGKAGGRLPDENLAPQMLLAVPLALVDPASDAGLHDDRRRFVHADRLGGQRPPGPELR